MLGLTILSSFLIICKSKNKWTRSIQSDDIDRLYSCGHTHCILWARLSQYNIQFNRDQTEFLAQYVISTIFFNMGHSLTLFTSRPFSLLSCPFSCCRVAVWLLSVTWRVTGRNGWWWRGSWQCTSASRSLSRCLGARRTCPTESQACTIDRQIMIARQTGGYRQAARHIYI